MQPHLSTFVKKKTKSGLVTGIDFCPSSLYELNILLHTLQNIGGIVGTRVAVAELQMPIYNTSKASSHRL